MDEVLEPAFATLVNLRVQDFRDLILRFSVENNCEGDAADKATIIDYSKTGANKR